MSNIVPTFVRTNTGAYLVQLPDANRWGFVLASDDQTWDGGIGVAEQWEAVKREDVPQDVRDRLEWLLDEGLPSDS